jgi:hypothetical protein
MNHAIPKATQMKTTLLLLGVLGGMAVNCVAQTNQLSTTRAGTVPALRKAGLADFQRLQYYYAAHPASPAPGTERGVFTLKADRTWSGDWNSKVVPKPTRAQLDAITAEQVDLFKRAARFHDGRWQVVTSEGNVPVAELATTKVDYERLRVAAERDKLAKQVQQLDAVLRAPVTTSLTATGAVDKVLVPRTESP